MIDRIAETECELNCIKTVAIALFAVPVVGIVLAGLYCLLRGVLMDFVIYAVAVAAMIISSI